MFSNFNLINGSEMCNQNVVLASNQLFFKKNSIIQIQYVTRIWPLKLILVWNILTHKIGQIQYLAI